MKLAARRRGAAAGAEDPNLLCLGKGGQARLLERARGDGRDVLPACDILGPHAEGATQPLIGRVVRVLVGEELQGQSLEARVVPRGIDAFAEPHQHLAIEVAAAHVDSSSTR